MAAGEYVFIPETILTSKDKNERENFMMSLFEQAKNMVDTTSMEFEGSDTSVLDSDFEVVHGMTEPNTIQQTLTFILNKVSNLQESQENVIKAIENLNWIDETVFFVNKGTQTTIIDAKNSIGNLAVKKPGNFRYVQTDISGDICRKIIVMKGITPGVVSKKVPEHKKKLDVKNGTAELVDEQKVVFNLEQNNYTGQIKQIRLTK